MMLRRDMDVRSMRAAIVILLLLLAHVLLLAARERQLARRETPQHAGSGYAAARMSPLTDRPL